MATAEYTPYSTIRELLGATLPGWIVDPIEQARIASYDLYEKIYWAVPETFKVVQRGEDDEPIYIPAARTVVETLHRYMANDMEVVCDPAFGTDQERELANAMFQDLASRERFYSKFNTNKRMGIIRGDWVFHMRGDVERDAGARISIETIHPNKLFPIKNEEEDIIGWMIVDHVTEEGKKFIQRTDYRKTTEKGGPSPITVETNLYELDAWGGPGQGEEKVVRSVTPLETFPSPIDQLPIYHVPNFSVDEFLWGSSELRGFERMLSAIDQSISDEELELVLNGLGCYATDASQPVDDSGNKLPWDLGPGRVVVVPRLGHFTRVTGTTTVSPHQDHLQYLHDQLDMSSGTPAVAKGRVDVTVAESGIALTIEMGPLLSRAVERETIVTDVTKNYLYDLNKWIIAYEGSAWNFLLTNIRFKPIYGTKIPVNEEKKFDQIVKLATAVPMPIIPLPVAWDELRNLGWELPTNEEMLAMLLEQKAAEIDSVANRIDRELEEGQTDDGQPVDEEAPVVEDTEANTDPVEEA